MRTGLSGNEATLLLRAWGAGDREALDRLTPIVYDEQRRLARNYLKRELPAHSLQATVLVNEAYLCLVDGKNIQWQDRNHFFAVSAKLMRRVLVEHARRHNSKRGGNVRHVVLNEVVMVGAGRSRELLALDVSLNELARIDPRKMQVVEMRFFGGLSVDEIADVLKVSPDTAMRDWKMAQAWLHRELSGNKSDE
jgi:RNA polymerase sigma factor (TIGR02999 family)